METEPQYLTDMRANLTDDLYEQMTANPDARLPYLVVWPKVQRELSAA